MSRHNESKEKIEKKDNLVSWEFEECETIKLERLEEFIARAKDPSKRQTASTREREYLRYEVTFDHQLYDSHHESIVTIYGVRMETDREFEYRQEQLDRERIGKEKKDIVEYERLKKKFGR